MDKEVLCLTVELPREDEVLCLMVDLPREDEVPVPDGGSSQGGGGAVPDGGSSQGGAPGDRHAARPVPAQVEQVLAASWPQVPSS